MNILLRLSGPGKPVCRAFTREAQSYKLTVAVNICILWCHHECGISDNFDISYFIL